jgi:hypothetical protein
VRDTLRRLRGAPYREALAAVHLAIRHPEQGQPTRVSGAEPGDQVVRAGLWLAIYGFDEFGNLVIRFLHRAAI